MCYYLLLYRYLNTEMTLLAIAAMLVVLSLIVSAVSKLYQWYREIQYAIPVRDSSKGIKILFWVLKKGDFTTAATYRTSLGAGSRVSCRGLL